MSDHSIPLDDPRLTAYALGELSPAESAAIDQLVAGSPSHRVAVEEIRSLAGLLTSELLQEPALPLTESQRMAIARGAMQPAVQPAAPVIAAPPRRWVGRLASLATIAGMLVVALLLVPSRQRNESRHNPLAEQNAVPALAYQSDVAAGKWGNIVDGKQSFALEEVRRETKNTIFRAERLAEKDPVQARTLIEQAESKVRNAGVDAKDRSQLMKALEASRGNVKYQSLLNAPRNEMAGRRKEIESAIRNEEAVKVHVDERLADTVQRYNLLMEQKRFYDAEVLAKKAKQLEPQNPVGEAMYYKSRMAAQEWFNAQSHEKKADAFTTLLNDVDESAASYTDSIDYGDVTKWKQLTERRKRYKLKDGRAMTKEEERIEKSLSREVSLHLEDAPFTEAVRNVASLGEFNIVVDPSVMKNAKLSTETPISINVDGIRLKSALNLMLEPLQLAYKIENEVIRITDKTSVPLDATVQLDVAPGTEAYDPIIENPFVAPTAEPLSTFGVDVDTASYANVRRFLTNQQMPPRNAVRIEELVNYFRYDYPQPAAGQPVSINVEVGRAPWRPGNRLVRIGLKGREIPRDKRPTSNFVFLVDVSGSMQSENKLPLVKAGLSMLTEQMTESDRVAIVTYSDTAALRLESTTGDNRQPILNTIAGLQANGSTNGAGGIQLAYETAVRHFIEGGVNRVILCTDGDFNVGVTGDDELVKLIEERARSKVFFSVFGFGMGNLKDGKLEKLADKGNGHYAYIDGQREAKKVFVDELSGTLVTIAKDVKLQVEFNPARVGAYRLIGYENRALAAQDFNNDKKDAGDMGAGHTVTALYEIVPADKLPQQPAEERLRYQRVSGEQAADLGRELLSVKMRYKDPEGETSALLEVPVVDPFPAAGDPEAVRKQIESTAPARPSRDFEWAAAVAAFGMVLRDSQFRGQASFDLILELAQAAKGEDPGGHRQEFIHLVEVAKSLRPVPATPAESPKE